MARAESKLSVSHDYRYVTVDFVKHLASTLITVLILTVTLAVVFGSPQAPHLTIQRYALNHPKTFEKVALGDLMGTGAIASYGPPYNAGTAMVQSPMQQSMGILFPFDPRMIDVINPLRQASTLNGSLGRALTDFLGASSVQQKLWESRYQKALDHAARHGHSLTVPPGGYGPVGTMMAGLLKLGQSGLYRGAITKSSSYYQFNSTAPLLFLQGIPLHQLAARSNLLGEQWGLIHEENPYYPGPWWLVLVTAIYQIPAIANSPAADAEALGIGLLLWVILYLWPWIPGLNRLPKRLGVYRWMWSSFYRRHEEP